MGNPFDSSNLQNMPVRPLSLGMFQNLPSNGIPEGGFWRIQNYRVETAGLKRRGGFTEYDSNLGTGVDQYGGKLYDLIYFYQRSGSAEQLLLTGTQLYRITGNGVNDSLSYIPVTATVISNTVSFTEQFTVTIPGTSDEEVRMRRFDVIEINGTYFEVNGSSFDGSNIVLTVVGNATLNEFAGETLNYEERFYSEKGLGPSYAILPSVSNSTVDTVVIADQAERGLYQYTSSGGLEPYVIDSTDGIEETNYLIGAKTVTYFDDRLWFGSTEETADGIFRQRIRWSDAVNFARVAPGSYTDLPYGEGELLRLVPLGSLLVAYYTDAIYIGRRTNMAGQPYYFERVESGNVGLVSSRAVVRHIDTHYFVGEDNIYKLSGSAGFQEIGDPVLEEALFFTKEKELMKEIQVEHDPATKSIVFLFPDRTEASYPDISSISTRLWRYYYVTNAWAYDEVPFLDPEKTNPLYFFTAILPSKLYIFSRSWESWEDLGEDASWTGEQNIGGAILPGEPGYPGSTSVGPDPADESFEEWNTWTALSDDRLLGKTLKIGILSAPLNREVLIAEKLLEEQDSFVSLEYPIWALIESGDTDTNLPDYTKTVTRLSIKAMHIYSERESPLMAVGGVFTLNISDKMGYHWKRPLTFRFKNNYNEGYANFRSTGSTFRFKLINSQVIAPFRLSEYVLRLVGRGLQVEA